MIGTDGRYIYAAEMAAAADADGFAHVERDPPTIFVLSMPKARG